MLELYRATATRACRPIEVCPELYPYTKTLFELYGQPINRISQTGKLMPEVKERSNYGLVALSGGKDSLALLLKNLKRFKGKIECYYVQHINRLDPSEMTIASSIAERLKLKLQIIDFPLRINTWLPESIIKNQMIYALMLDASPFLPSSVGFGITNKVGLQSMAFFHDSEKAFDLFHKFAVCAWGYHRLISPLEDEVESFRILRERAPRNFVDLVASCMTEEKAKEDLRDEVYNRYNLAVTNKYSCGLCYKCAEKTVIESRFFGIAYPLGYIERCRRILLDKADTTIPMNGYPREYLKKLGCRA